MEIKEVKSEKDKEDFIKVAVKINKSDPHWIRPLDKDINGIFDPEKNKYFGHGKATRWILRDEKNQLIGRVAAFINNKTSHTFDQPTGGMGFFECVNDKKAARILFDTCKKWLSENGMEAMDGPINFGEKDKWWGLLTDGFTEPTYCSNYNPRYYKELFESYGFQTYYEQYNYSVSTQHQVPSKFIALAQRVARNTAYSARHIEKSKLKQYAEDFRIIYNLGWSKHDNFAEMSKEQALALVKTIKPIMDEKLIWFAYHNNDPIGFFVMLPEINQVFKYLNGKFNLWSKLKFAWLMRKGVCRKIFGVAFGIVPEHQGKGLESFLIMEADKVVPFLGTYDELEMTWIGDFNPKMIHLVESLGAQKVRTFITCRKLFDETKPFMRAPIIG
jgi:hypothetical protein